MSKDVIIAGAIAVGCIALIAVAFIAPKKANDSETVKTETTTTLTDPNGFGSGMPGVDPLQPLPPSTTTAFNQTPGDFGSHIPNTGFAAPTFPSTTTGANTTSVPPAAPIIPPAPETPVVPAVSETKTHIVAKDELLGDIALKYYGSSKLWKKIAEANPGLDPKNMKVGQKLTIPAAADKPAETSATTTTTTTGTERTYTVKAGDTLYVIAKKELGSASRWKEIEKLNNMSSSDLHVGKSIKLPGAATPSATTPATNEAASSGTVHVVAKGETLGDISAKYLKSSKNWKKLVEANPGISPENLKVGQKIVIPQTAGNADASSGVSAVPGSETSEYTIKAGDTLSTVAQATLGSKNRWKEIQDVNPGLDSRHLRTGQKIKIPAKKADAATPTPAIEQAAPPAFPAPAPTSGLGGSTSPITPTAPISQAPTAFPTDSSFNSPYAGSNFGQPAQPFDQPASTTGGPATQTAPPAQPFSPAPSTGFPSQDGNNTLR